MLPGDALTSLLSSRQFAKACVDAAKVELVERGQFRNCVCIPVDYARQYCQQQHAADDDGATTEEDFRKKVAAALKSHPPFIKVHRYQKAAHFLFAWGRSEPPREDDIVQLLTVRKGRGSSSRAAATARQAASQAGATQATLPPSPSVHSHAPSPRAAASPPSTTTNRHTQCSSRHLPDAASPASAAPPRPSTHHAAHTPTSSRTTPTRPSPFIVRPLAQTSAAASPAFSSQQPRQHPSPSTTQHHHDPSPTPASHSRPIHPASPRHDPPPSPEPSSRPPRPSNPHPQHPAAPQSIPPHQRPPPPASQDQPLSPAFLSSAANLARAVQEELQGASPSQVTALVKDAMADPHIQQHVQDYVLRRLRQQSQEPPVQRSQQQQQHQQHQQEQQKQQQQQRKKREQVATFHPAERSQPSTSRSVPTHPTTALHSSSHTARQPQDAPTLSHSPTPTAPQPPHPAPPHPAARNPAPPRPAARNPAPHQPPHKPAGPSTAPPRPSAPHPGPPHPAASPRASPDSAPGSQPPASSPQPSHAPSHQPAAPPAPHPGLSRQPAAHGAPRQQHRRHARKPAKPIRNGSTPGRSNPHCQSADAASAERSPAPPAAGAPPAGTSSAHGTAGTRAVEASTGMAQALPGGRKAAVLGAPHGVKRAAGAVAASQHRGAGGLGTEQGSRGVLEGVMDRAMKRQKEV